MTHRQRALQTLRRRTLMTLLTALVLVVLPACLGEDGIEQAATVVPSATTTVMPATSPTPELSPATPTAISPSPPAAPPSATSGRPVPTMPPLSPVATATPTVRPTVIRTPDTSGVPLPIPAGQEEDLPDVALTYAIDARLRDFDSGIVDALSVTTMTNQSDAPLDRLYFRIAPAQFNEFTLNDLTRDGTGIDVIASDNGTTLEVVLDPPLAPAATTELRFDFVVPLRETDDGFASIGRDGAVLRLGFWYPMLSNDDGYPPLLDPPYTLSADYDVRFTAPADVVVAASADAMGTPEPSENGVTYSYTLSNGRDFALMLSRDYELDERTTASGIVVRQYTLASEYGISDETRAQIRDRVFAVAERSLDEFVANIGPYPWPSLTLAEAGPGLGGGIEYTALTIISYDSGALENLVAHEIAHMWFYAAIGTRTQDDPWIDEGAATFLGNGISNRNYASSSDRGAINYVAPLDSSIPDLTRFNGGEWVAAVYTQGGSFFADTYITMGEDAFWAAMGAVYSTQVFEIATPWEVLTTFQSYSSVDLSPIFERYFTYPWLDAVE